MIENDTGTPFGLSTISGCADAIVRLLAFPAPLLLTRTRMYAGSPAITTNGAV